MASEEKDEKRGLFSGFGGSSAGEKSYGWLPFAFLFLFLAAGGFYAWNAMKGAAHKLAGGDSYNSLSANSAVYGSGSSVKKEDNFFASDEDLSSLSGKKAEKAGLTASMASAAGTEDGSGQAGPAGPSGYPENPESGVFSYSGPGGQSNTLQSKLQARQLALSGMKGAQTSKSTGFSDESGGEKPSVVPVASTGKKPDAQAPKKGPGASVLESLKSAFKSSLYGARLTSQDAASAWIAKSFTAAPEEEMALQYDDKMRTKLDKVNPNSIPNFLRNQDINATEAKTLGVSDVDKPDVDKDATKEALKDDKDYQAKKVAQDMAGGMLNPLFSGMNFGGGSGGGGDQPPSNDNSLNTEPSDDPAGDATATERMENPDTTPKLNTTADEFGGDTAVPGDNGLNYLFSSEGGMLGCEDSGAGMCLMPGYGGCPGGLSFGDKFLY